MGYTAYDFEESLKHKESPIAREQVEQVIAAWGEQGEDGGAEWEGGFLLALKDGRFAHLSGICDYTGWGCQDGVSCLFYEQQPALEELGWVFWDDQPKAEPQSRRWDMEPSDLNRWLAGEVVDMDEIRGESNE